MNQDIQDLLQRANDSLQAARVLYRESYYDFAVSRAYYAMFYTAEALLLSKGLSFSSHSAVIASFGREFAKSGIVNPEIHRHLVDTEKLRNVSDYDIRPRLKADQAIQVFAWVEEFLEVAHKILS